jgi:radical SAM protein with 4Fe4S-binding SPASM domain
MPHRSQPSIPRLKVLELQLTSACQYNCAYCGNPEDVLPQRADAELLSRLIREVRPERISFTGGEPTLAWDLLIELLDIAAGVGSATQLNTNCRALTEERVRELEDHGLGVLHASLSTLDPELFARVRRTDDAQGVGHILRMIEYACERGHMRVIVEAMLMRGLLDGLEDVYRFARKAGADEFELQAIVPTSEGMWDTVPDDDDLVRAVDSLVAHGSPELPITLCCLHLPDCRGYERWTTSEGVERYPCGCGRDTVYVEVDGTVLPCSFFHQKLGNAREGLEAIWRDASLLRRLRVERPAACEACASWDSCRNTCPAIVYADLGGFNELAFDAHRALRDRLRRP